MITYLPMKTEAEWGWLTERAKVGWCEDTNGIVAYKNGEIVGMVAMDNWTHNSCTMHIAVDDMQIFRHGWPEEVFGYVFNTCGKGVIIGITPGDNEVALKFNRHIGFEEIYRVRDAYKVGVPYVIQEYRKENCKYLRNRNGQEICAAAA